MKSLRLSRFLVYIILRYRKIRHLEQSHWTKWTRFYTILYLFLSYTRTIRVSVSTFARQWRTHYHRSVGHYLSFRHPENRETQAEHYANRIYRKHRISFLRQWRNRTVLLPRQFIHIMMYVMKNFNGQCDYLNRRFVNVDSVSVSDRYRKYSILPSPPFPSAVYEEKAKVAFVICWCYQTAKEKRNDEKRVTTTRGLISFHWYRTRIWIRVDSLFDRRWVIERVRNRAKRSMRLKGKVIGQRGSDSPRKAISTARGARLLLFAFIMCVRVRACLCGGIVSWLRNENIDVAIVAAALLIQRWETRPKKERKRERN